jgi:microcystin-dependent protein
MSSFYIGEIRAFPFDFAPKYWATCSGQILSIAQNTALFSLLGTTYGGNGVTTFALPDLRGRSLISYMQGPGLSQYSLGEVAGQEGVTLTQTQIPQHTHLWKVSSDDASQNPPVNGYLAKVNRTGIGYLKGYAAPGGLAVVLGNTLASTGGSQPHNNMQPSIVLNYCIALQGIFPSRN